MKLDVVEFALRSNSIDFDTVITQDCSARFGWVRPNVGQSWMGSIKLVRFDQVRVRLEQRLVGCGKSFCCFGSIRAWFGPGCGRILGWKVYSTAHLCMCSRSTFNVSIVCIICVTCQHSARTSLICGRMPRAIRRETGLCHRTPSSQDSGMPMHCIWNELCLNHLLIKL